MGRLTGPCAGNDAQAAPPGMPALTDLPTVVRLPTREALLQKRRGWFFRR